MTLSAEYLLLGAAVLGGAGLLLDDARESTKQLGDNFGQQVKAIGKSKPKEASPVHAVEHGCVGTCNETP